MFYVSIKQLFSLTVAFGTVILAKSWSSKNNHSFWEEKIAKNKTRDIENIRILEEMGWHVITVWQCELLNVTKRENKLEEIVNILHYFKNE